MNDFESNHELQGQTEPVQRNTTAQDAGASFNGANPFLGGAVDQAQSPKQAVLTVNGPKSKARTAAFIAATVLCAILCLSCLSCTAIVGGAFQGIGMSTMSGSIDSSPKVGVISLGSTIQYDGSSCSPSGLRTLLDQAAQRDDIKAVVLRINSGGGTATAGEEMAKYVSEFEKPIVVSCAATTASAAYEIASQSDFIYAAKTSSVGSIGVAMQVTDLSGLYEKLGIDIDNITSAESKDSTYGNRPLTKSERQWYQDMVNKIDADFIATVAQGRGMSVEEVEKLANGLTYTGSEAVENKLADEVGYLDDAIFKASQIAGFSAPLSDVPLALSSSASISSILDLLSRDDSGNLENAIASSLDDIKESN